MSGINHIRETLTETEAARIERHRAVQAAFRPVLEMFEALKIPADQQRPIVDGFEAIFHAVIP